MLRSTSTMRKPLIGSTILAVISSFFISTQTHAKRYIPAKDSEVEYTINRAHADEYTIDKEKIKILVWNLYKGEKDSFVKDYKKLTAGKDILLLQEGITNKRMKPVLEADTERTYHVATSFFDSEDGWARSGTATASRYRAMEVKWQRSRHHEPMVKTPKMISIAKFDLEATDEDLLTLSIHGVNFVSAAKLEDQIQQAALLISRHKGPVVFGGDFNTWSKKKLNVMRTTLSRIGLKEVPFGAGRMETFGKPLDHVFIKGLKLNSSKVHKDVEGSDHKALEVEVSLP